MLANAVDCHVNLMTVYRAATEPKTWASSLCVIHGWPKPTGLLSLDNESWISPASLLKIRDLKLALQVSYFSKVLPLTFALLLVNRGQLLGQVGLLELDLGHQFHGVDLPAVDPGDVFRRQAFRLDDFQSGRQLVVLVHLSPQSLLPGSVQHPSEQVPQFIFLLVRYSEADQAQGPGHGVDGLFHRLAVADRVQLGQRLKEGFFQPVVAEAWIAVFQILAVLFRRRGPFIIPFVFPAQKLILLRHVIEAVVLELFDPLEILRQVHQDPVAVKVEFLILIFAPLFHQQFPFTGHIVVLVALVQHGEFPEVVLVNVEQGGSGG